MKPVPYHRPKKLEDAWELKEKMPDARYVAGGTDLMVQIKNGQLRPSALISLRSISELTSIFQEADGITHIGAMATFSAIIQHGDLGQNYPLLAETARHIGSVQIRNVASIGGNLCNGSPCADIAPSLLVLGARVRLQNRQSTRDIPVQDFFKGPGESVLASDEILTAVLLDPAQKNSKATFLKKGRVKMDLALASVAVLLETSEKKCLKCRIAAGSVAPVPLRLTKVEALLEGSLISRALLEKAGELARENVSPISDIRATEEYRRQIVGVYLKRGLESLLGWREG